jgi:hypothetical protein
LQFELTAFQDGEAIDDFAMQIDSLAVELRGLWEKMEDKCDEDMTPTDTTIDYKVHSFLYLHSNFGYNLLGPTCTCHYLNVGTNVSQSANLSKLNFRFVGSPIVLHWEGHNSSIQSAIEVNEHLMKRLFDKLSNRSSTTSISHWKGL